MDTASSPFLFFFFLGVAGRRAALLLPGAYADAARLVSPPQRPLPRLSPAPEQKVKQKKAKKIHESKQKKEKKNFVLQKKSKRGEEQSQPLKPIATSRRDNESREEQESGPSPKSNAYASQNPINVEKRKKKEI